ncbi:MAG: FAD-dependent oxidoreductase [Chlorobi bacterium]|nr:FAD-dependent oxidoreductase [Chlorobiota bacterium]MCI0716705.1 FAD-dependent oxidoreductase [Chlorobiota bacterium]
MHKKEEFSPMNELKLKHGFHYEDLFEPLKLKELANKFYDFYKNSDPSSFEKFAKYRDSKGAGFNEIETSNIIIEAGRFLDTFIADFFGIKEQAEELKRSNESEKAILKVRSEFVTRRVLKKFKEPDLASLKYAELDSQVQILKDVLYPDYQWNSDEEKATAFMIRDFLGQELNYKNHLEVMPGGFVFDEKIVEKAGEDFNKLKSSEKGKIFTENLTIGTYKNTEGTDEQKLLYEYLKNIMEFLQKWCFAKIHTEKHKVKNWVLFKQPMNVDFNDLVHNKAVYQNIPEKMQGEVDTLRRRDGFKLTNKRYNDRMVMGEVEYCVFCHERNKDSCSKGLKEKDGAVKKNPLGIVLNGCPLDEKISEMHLLKYEGRSVGALSLIMIDNPMCPGTGHRICNDCMKGCIYQKQEPVNIPQIETRVLTDVLNLPWGFEIYSLLTRWNPVNVKRPYPLPYNGKNIMVIGMGPAGYTLTQYLLNEGFGVIGVDGLKIEAVHKDITGGLDENGNYIYPKPVAKFSDIEDELDKRIFLGFGGVSEYGITVRWDKNFLKVVYLTLARRKYFKPYNGIRFGGTIEIDDAWKLGIDHIAIATGAGKPTIVRMKNNLIRGIRKASDFLMALQLTGAAKKDSLANLMLQLPAIVIGGGLTAIDTSTEAFAYYPIQVEKFLNRFEISVKEFGEDTVWAMYDDEEKSIAKTFIEHGKEVRAERKRAAEKGEEPNFVPLVRKWGGVTLVYRKSIEESPAYRLNHEEIIKSLEEGIYYWEKMSPVEAVPDQYGAVKEMVFSKQTKNSEGKWIDLGEKITLPAKSVLVAAGTSPNIIYEREHPGTFQLDERGNFFQTYKLDGNNNLIKAEKNETGFFTSYNKDGKFITVYGDNHPRYAGNVVKAMASARDGFKELIKIYKDDIKEPRELGAENDEKFKSLVGTLDNEFLAVVEEVNILTPTIVEVVLKAPLQARKFHPGQFYRLQNYETNAQSINGTSMMMEGLALTGAWVDVDKGLLSLIILEMWGSSRLCRFLKKGEKVIVMGPTGTPTEIPTGENVLLAGGGLGNAVLFSVAKALKDNGNKVIYFAGYRNSGDLFKQDEVEEGTDQVVWSNDFGEQIKPRRPQDRTITANIVQAMIAYADGKLEPNGTGPMFDLKQVNRIIAIGSDRMMKAVKEARYGVLKDYINPVHTAIASINSTMQCMMKEVCAQCLQRHVDPISGKETFVFSCFNQDQQMDLVDFNNLNARLKSNSVLEKLTKFWLDYLFKKSLP